MPEKRAQQSISQHSILPPVYIQRGCPCAGMFWGSLSSLGSIAEVIKLLHQTVPWGRLE